MPKHRFSCAEGALRAGAEVVLSPDESHHLAKVLRLGAGDEIYLIDGRGALAKGDVVAAAAKGARVAVREVSRSGERSRVRLCFAIPKGPAQDFLVRRSTEVGVGAFQPLGSRFSLKAKEWNDDRWPRVVAEVAKQCEELWWPELLPALPLEDWLATRDRARTLVLCDEAKRAPGANLSGDCDLLVGAEGGWSEEERRAILAAGAVPLGLGKNRLRAETAALTATILLKHLLGEI